MRSLSLLAVLALVGCAHQQHRAEPFPELPPLPASAFVSAPDDEGGGGYLPPVPYYLATETMSQAEAPVGSPSWLGNAYSMTLSAPQGTATSPCLVQGGSGTTGVCLGGYPGAGFNALYLGVSPASRTAVNMALRSNGSTTDLNGAGALNLAIADTNQWTVNAVAFYPTTDAVEDLGGSANRVRDGWFARDVTATSLGLGAGLADTKVSLFTSGGSVYGLGIQPGDFRLHTADATNVFTFRNGAAASAVATIGGGGAGIQLNSTAALPTCAVALEGTLKRDGTTGAASTARTRLCLCTSDGAAVPAYVWQNVVSATLGTATTCAP